MLLGACLSPVRLKGSCHSHRNHIWCRADARSKVPRGSPRVCFFSSKKYETNPIENTNSNNPHHTSRRNHIWCRAEARSKVPRGSPRVRFIVFGYRVLVSPISGYWGLAHPPAIGTLPVPSQQARCCDSGTTSRNMDHATWITPHGSHTGHTERDCRVIPGAAGPMETPPPLIARVVRYQARPKWFGSQAFPLPVASVRTELPSSGYGGGVYCRAWWRALPATPPGGEWTGCPTRSVDPQCCVKVIVTDCPQVTCQLSAPRHVTARSQLNGAGMTSIHQGGGVAMGPGLSPCNGGRGLLRMGILFFCSTGYSWQLRGWY